MRLLQTTAISFAVFVALALGREESKSSDQPHARPHDAAITDAAAEVASSGDLMALRFSPHGAEEFVVVIDSKDRSLAAYGLSERHLWELKSVRNIDGDLKMDWWNGTLPKPSNIRRMLDVNRR
ncbi:MAG: hypothetical protein AAF961_01475 [Planctomycetota bacterium]